jgi:hypothetical protein
MGKLYVELSYFQVLPDRDHVPDRLGDGARNGQCRPAQLSAALLTKTISSRAGSSERNESERKKTFATFRVYCDANAYR